VTKRTKYPDEIEDRAWDDWSRAWDAARDADVAAGRRYDKARYTEAAHNARMAVLNAAGINEK
jgi:hypothetical protein